MAHPVVTHYQRLASRYDQRWRRYHQDVAARILAHMSLRGNEHLLDVGCGTGELEQCLHQHGCHARVVGVDLTWAMLQQAARKLPASSWVAAHAAQLPFAPQVADVVVCANMLHCAPHPEAILAEGVRVLRPGGRLVLVDWARDFWHCRLLHHWLRRTNPAYVQMWRLADAVRWCGALSLQVTHTELFTASPWYGLWLVAARRP